MVGGHKSASSHWTRGLSAPIECISPLFGGRSQPCSEAYKNQLLLRQRSVLLDGLVRNVILLCVQAHAHLAIIFIFFGEPYPEFRLLYITVQKNMSLYLFIF